MSHSNTCLRIFLHHPRPKPNLAHSSLYNLSYFMLSFQTKESILLSLALTMPSVIGDDFDTAVENVVRSLPGIVSLYQAQLDVLRHLVNQENIFVTQPTNSGKTSAPVILPKVLQELNKYGYEFPSDPKVLFVTALNREAFKKMIEIVSLVISRGVRNT